MKLTERDVAQTLMELLYEYLEITHLWEAHWRKANNREYAPGEESRAYAHIEQKHIRPFSGKCRSYGFVYADVTDILPRAFKTTKQERNDVVHDLDDYAQAKYGITGAIPF